MAFCPPLALWVDRFRSVVSPLERETGGEYDRCGLAPGSVVARRDVLR